MKILSIFVFIVVILGGVWFLINENQTEEIIDIDEVAILDEFNMGEEDISREDISGQGFYGDYSEDKLALANEGDVVLFFRASWCPSCRALDQNIEANLSNLPADLTILKLDYDTETELKRKYGVTTQHTLVLVDANGNEIKKWTGGSTLESIIANLN